MVKLEKVQKFLAIAKLGSRKEIEELIRNNKVKVNNKFITLGDKCLETDKIEVEGKLIEFNIEKKTYIVMNKKIGYTCTKSEELGRKTIFYMLSPKDNLDDLFSIGRLDRHTTGIVILTNDHGLSQKINHPQKELSREYIVGLDKPLIDIVKTKIESGQMIDKIQLKPCTISTLGARYIVKITEDRKKQITRMFKKEGYEVESLELFKIGNLNLSQLKIEVGKYKKVSKELLLNQIFGE